MNKKGQSLILFVIFLPVIICLLILVIDLSYVRINNTKLKNIAYDATTYLVSGKTKEEVREFILLNDEDITIVNIDHDSVHLTKNIKSIFGTYLDYDRYKLSINVYGYKEEEKIIIKEKG